MVYSSTVSHSMPVFRIIHWYCMLTVKDIGKHNAMKPLIYIFLLCLSQIFLFCTYIVLYILYMMTSVVSNQARGTRDRTLPTTTQTTQPQKQIQVGFCHCSYQVKGMFKELFCSRIMPLYFFDPSFLVPSSGHSRTDSFSPNDLRQK